MTFPPSSFLRTRREALKLQMIDVQHQTKALGGEVGGTALTYLEDGRLLPSVLRPSQVRALREVLSISFDEWAALLAAE